MKKLKQKKLFLFVCVAVFVLVISAFFTYFSLDLPNRLSRKSKDLPNFEDNAPKTPFVKNPVRTPIHQTGKQVIGFPFLESKGENQLDLEGNVNKTEVYKKPSNFVSVRDPANTMFPVAPGIVPAGTQMMIPPWILQQYHSSPQKALYGDALNFLIYNYGDSAPSISEEGEDDIYVPLTRYKSDDYYKSYSKYDDDYDDSDRYDYDDSDRYDYDDSDRGSRKTVMMPVTHLTVEQQNQPPGNTVPLEGSPQGTQTPKETKKPHPPPPHTPPQAGASPLQNNGPVITVTKVVDKAETPNVSPRRPEPDLSTVYPATCEKPGTHEKSTEARSLCTHCSFPSQTDNFLQKVDTTVNRYTRGKKFQTIINKICETCPNVDISDLIGYIEQRTKSNNVPPEIMFAIIIKESSGQCFAEGDKNKSSDHRSIGLFQLYTKNSTKLRTCTPQELKNMNAQTQKEVCTNGQYRNNSTYNTTSWEQSPNSRPNIKQGVCLNNPYCNFEEALHLLIKEKWKTGNGNTPIPQGEKNWTEMTSEERNLWRNAIISYNTGSYLKKAESYMKALNVDSEYFDNWELKRMFFVRQYLDLSTPKKKSSLIGNLAYVERITGREKPGGLAESGICQWTQFRMKHKSLSCK